MNVMNEYSKITKKFMINYFKIILGNKFNRKLLDEFIKVYFDTRYYNLYEIKNRNELKKTILQQLDKKKRDLIKEDKDNKKYVELIRAFYSYIIYFDYVIQTKEYEKIMNNINEKRKILLGKDDPEIIEQLANLHKSYEREILEMLELLETNEFYLEAKKNAQKPELIETKLKYNIKFPIIYSDFAIQKAFESGSIKEEKQFVEYYLVAGEVIKDITKGNLKKQYIVEIVDTILKKKQKLKRILEIIDNSVMQDKIILKIGYKEYLKSKYNVSELIQRGFKIAIVLDDSFKYNESEIGRLEIFELVFVHENLKYYDDIVKHEKEIKNLIEVKKE